MAGRTLQDVPILVAGDPAFLQDIHVDGLIGLPLLLLYDAKLSLAQRRLALRPNHLSPPQFVHWRLGIAVSTTVAENEAASLVITEVWPNSPAAKAGLAEGEIIESIVSPIVLPIDSRAALDKILHDHERAPLVFAIRGADGSVRQVAMQAVGDCATLPDEIRLQD